MKHFLFAVALVFVHAMVFAQTRLTEAPAPSARKAQAETTERKAPADATVKSGSATGETFTYKLITLRLDGYGFIQPESADDLRANMKGAINDSATPEKMQELQDEMDMLLKFRSPVSLLNKLGEDGWELVHVISQPMERTSRVQYYLKKRVKRP